MFCFSTKETFEHKAIEKSLSDEEEGSEEEPDARAVTDDVQKYMKNEVISVMLAQYQYCQQFEVICKRIFHTNTKFIINW